MEQERQSIAVEIPVVEGCFSEEAQRLLQPKSGSRLEGWGESLLEVTKQFYVGTLPELSHSCFADNIRTGCRRPFCPHQIRRGSNSSYCSSRPAISEILQTA